MNLVEKDQKYIWHPFTQMKTSGPALPIVKGEGTLLTDESGKSYIDAISSWWVNLHGHSHPYIAQKVFEQMQKLEHVVFAGFTHQPAVDLCEKLSRHLPDNQAKFFFSGDGSSAVEIALKMSVQYWKNKGENKTRFVALEGAYHGETFGAMSAGARSIFSAHFSDMLFESTHIPFPKEEQAAIQSLKTEIAKGDVAAFIFEPLVQGAAGMRMYDASTLNKLIQICKKAGVLCIADEVMTGFGRTGTTFAVNQIEAKPDFICMSKGLSGGTLPLSLTSCTQDIYEAFLGDDIHKAFLHGHSFTGNPIGCTAALASLELLEKKECREAIEKITENHKAFTEQLGALKVIEEIRQTGTILAIELKSDRSGYASKIRQKLYDDFLKRGVLLRPLGNVIYILPPYCIQEKELKKVYEVIQEKLIELSQN
ncbi:MAG: adenosylmethionine--8-amino-7-oxononanoate transaminase [Flavobacteriales bacterium]|jgi:adenosylmethionine-8-amino-7-oxononanoate aminotransferase|nr:adenosylmethionine--8-amino-7-oxononanoate transaminase [Flavobacteriales bacterium]